MLSEAAQVVVGTLLYSIKFEMRDDALVDRRARALIEEPLGELTLEEEYQALVEALVSRATLSEVIRASDVPSAPREDEFRDFLRRLRDHMDGLRRPQAPCSDPPSAVRG